MKSSLLILFTLSSFFLCKSQKPLYYTEVIFVDSTTSKQELFDRARIWFTTYFTDSKEVIQVADKDYGELVFRGIIPYDSKVNELSSGTKGIISFDVKLYIKTGKYKYQFTNFRHEGTGGYEFLGSNSSTTRFETISFGLLTMDSLIPRDRFERKMDYGWQNRVWKDLKQFAGGRSYELVEFLKKSMLTPSPPKNDNW